MAALVAEMNSSLIQDATNLLIAAQVLLTAIIAVFAWYMRTAFVSRRDFQKFKAEELGPFREDVGKRLTAAGERLTAGDGRFNRIDDRIATLPAISEVTDLKLAVERLSGDVRVLGQKLEGFDDLQQVLRTQIERMDEFLRRQA